MPKKKIRELKKYRGKERFWINFGRPTKYRKEYIQEMLDYFNKSPIDPKTKEVIEFPTMEKFAADIAVSTRTLQEWASATNDDGSLKHEKFSRMYKLCQQYQKHILISNGLTGKYASNFATFVGVNLTDMVNKSEVDATSKGHRIGGFTYVVPENPDASTDIHSEN